MSCNPEREPSAARGRSPRGILLETRPPHGAPSDPPRSPGTAPGAKAAKISSTRIPTLMGGTLEPYVISFGTPAPSAKLVSASRGTLINSRGGRPPALEAARPPPRKRLWHQKHTSNYRCRGQEWKERGNETIATHEDVHCLTGHAGKGQQFDWVFVLGLEDGTIPDFRAKSPESECEEARALSVMISRARIGVFGTYTKGKDYRWGKYRENAPLEFTWSLSSI